ncbi:hypothetical protein NT239_01800 [Chitinibacter sp. SCUT-21]|uniref:AbrB/MazE/SpoVT family DNA-binding domain-containing protein n=1 Tax=Chitinibacter sp. SCUT-21 TaxID=2970891 RepID=UPI0035A67292
MKKSTWIVTLQPDPEGTEDALLIFPDEFIAQVDWNEGDMLNIEQNEDGSLLISKQRSDGAD